MLEMDENERIPIFLGRLFLATACVLIDVKNDKLTLNIGDNIIEFDVFMNNKELFVEPCYGDDLILTHGKSRIQSSSYLIENLKNTDLEETRSQTSNTSRNINSKLLLKHELKYV